MQLQQPWQRDRRTEQYVAKQLTGSRVILCDLRRREDLNGAEGKLLGFHEESDRWMVKVKEGGEQLRLKFANLRFIKEEGEEGPEDTAPTHGAPAVHSFHPPPTSMERLTDEEREAIERMTAVIQQTKWEPSEEVKREVQAIKPKPKEAAKVFVARALQQRPSYAGVAVALLFVVSSVLMAYVFATAPPDGVTPLPRKRSIVFP
mmetsp:Transcript_17784/g.44707  ORF Transcript_17784/g.44707 Transcript_17784/m.44707 type:complete len:204 (-) Transcript_17784:169-780(-)